jgi:hypothetical protein
VMWPTGQGGWRASRREADITFLTRLLFAAYFIEAGLILLVAPWSAFWQRNFFVDVIPFLADVAANPFVRGGVSGIGAITALAGFAELAGVFRSTRGSEPQPERNAEV